MGVGVAMDVAAGVAVGVDIDVGVAVGVEVGVGVGVSVGAGYKSRQDQAAPEKRRPGRRTDKLKRGD